MKRYNVSVIFSPDKSKLLMCKRTKEPYKDKYNFVGGKIESDDSLEEAYRELFEETNITKDDVNLKHIMDMNYYHLDYLLEIYYGILNKEVNLIEEVNKLEWIDLDKNFFDMDMFAGDGNIGHILKEIEIDIERNV